MFKMNRSNLIVLFVMNMSAARQRMSFQTASVGTSLIFKFQKKFRKYLSKDSDRS